MQLRRGRIWTPYDSLTSFARAFGYNKERVDNFKLLEEVYDKNVDETEAQLYIAGNWSQRKTINIFSNVSITRFTCYRYYLLECF